MNRLFYLVLSVSICVLVGCGDGNSSSIVVDRDEARELYDSEEFRAAEAAAEAAAQQEPSE